MSKPHVDAGALEDGPARATGWRAFWNGDNAIYVNARHRLVHDALIARDIAAVIPSPAAHVLDHGCGQATAAPIIAARCGQLYLCDAAPQIRERLLRRVTGNPKIAVLAPEDIAAAIPAASLDLVLANSLLQYLSRHELRDCLALWRSKLKPSGALILADVISPDVGRAADAAALLRFAAQGGFLIAALLGLGRLYRSDYRKLRQDLGLAVYAEADMLTLLAAAGFTAKRRYPNLGHNQARMSFIANPRP